VASGTGGVDMASGTGGAEDRRRRVPGGGAGKGRGEDAMGDGEDHMYSNVAYVQHTATVDPTYIF
jgi:hypothetical protein